MALKKASRLQGMLVFAAVLTAGFATVRNADHLAFGAKCLVLKARGLGPGCPWTGAVTIGRDTGRLVELQDRYQASLRLLSEDQKLGAEQYATPRGNFWIKKAGDMPGSKLLAYLLSEHDWVQQYDPEKSPKRGDIVMDCGAHVGVFTARALRNGAQKVIAVEPDPGNVECLRRNFAAEIAAGRVVVVDRGVWSKETTLVLKESNGNSGMNTVVGDENGQQISIRVTTIDRLATELGLPRIDYIKMDIEGAEREALAGGQEVLRRFKPILALDAYHRPDDPEVLPRVILSANGGYRVKCGPCEYNDERTANHDRLVPHILYYH